MKTSGCGACGASVPDKCDAAWPGWLTGTIRRRAARIVRGRLVWSRFGEANTFACCPAHRIHVVSRNERLQPKKLEPSPSILVVSAAKRAHPAGCYGCRSLLDSAGAALVRLVRAVDNIEEYVELRIRICRDCAIEVR